MYMIRLLIRVRMIAYEAFPWTKSACPTEASSRGYRSRRRNRTAALVNPPA
jgi:hypothetical protein